MKKHPIVQIVWTDAESIDSWTEGHALDHKITEVYSVGYLINSDKEAVTLALNHDVKNDSYSCIMKIPMGMITQKKTLRK